MNVLFIIIGAVSRQAFLFALCVCVKIADGAVCRQACSLDSRIGNWASKKAVGRLTHRLGFVGMSQPAWLRAVLAKQT